MSVPGGYTRSPFTVLIACLLSLRIQDKTTDEASARLFQLAETPQDMRKLSTAAIQKAIYPVDLHHAALTNENSFLIYCGLNSARLITRA